MNYEIKIKETSSRQYYWTLSTDGQNIVSPSAFADKSACYDDLYRLMDSISKLLGLSVDQLRLAS